MRLLLVLIAFSLIMSCSKNTITNASDHTLVFSDIKSDYVITDINKYGCEKIDKHVIDHILQTGIKISPLDEHDYYSTTGCEISGTLRLSGELYNFKMDYGGILWIGENLVIGCAEECCKQDFEYCTWDKEPD